MSDLDAISEPTRKPSPKGLEDISTPTEETGALPFFTKGLTETLGIPADVQGAIPGVGKYEGLPGFSRGDTERRFLAPTGSQRLREIVRSLGLPIAGKGQQPSNFGEYLGEAGGHTVGGVPLGGGLLGLAAKAPGLVGRTALKVIKGTRAHPGTAAASEALSTTGVAVARQYGDREYAGEPYKKVLLELGAGLVSGYIPSAVAFANRAAGTGRFARMAAPFTKAGGTARAARRLQDLSADPQAAARAARAPTVGGLSPATKTAEPRLLALEQEVLNTDAKLEGVFVTGRREATKRIRGLIEAIKKRGSLTDTREFIKERHERGLVALSERIVQAGLLIQQRMARLSPTSRRDSAASISREEIDKAYVTGRDYEKVVWADVEDAAESPTSSTYAAYNKTRLELSRAQQEDIPEVATRFLGLGPDHVIDEGTEAFGATESVKEMHGLYSKLREVQRQALASKDRNKARIAGEIADAILKDFNEAGDVSEAFKIARDTSRVLNDKFTRGPVGTLLGYAREGGASVDPTLTLSGLTGSGLTGTVKAKALLDAVGDNPEITQEAIRQTILRDFADFAAPDGKLNPAKARKFVHDNEELIELIPGLAGDLTGVDEAQAIVDQTVRTAEGRIKRLQDPNIAKTAQFLKAPVDRIMEEIVGSEDPGAFASELLRQTAKDRTGKARRGLKAGFIEHLLARSTGRTADRFLDLSTSGRTLLAALQEPNTSAVARKLLSSGEMSRLEKLGAELAKLEGHRDVAPNIGGDIMHDVPNNILTMITRVLAAQFGRITAGRLGGGTVQTPGMFSERAKAWLLNLTNDKGKQILIEAVKGGDGGKLFSTLLMDLSSSFNKRVAARQFEAWLFGPGRRLVEGEEEE